MYLPRSGTPVWGDLHPAWSRPLRRLRSEPSRNGLVFRASGNPMRFNTPDQVRTGEQLILKYGSWDKIRRNGRRTPQGHIVVSTHGTTDQELAEVLKELTSR